MVKKKGKKLPVYGPKNFVPSKMLKKSHPSYSLLSRGTDFFDHDDYPMRRIRGNRILTTPFNPDGEYVSILGAISRVHHGIERRRYLNWEQVMWDQPRTSKPQAQAGDLFAFCATCGEHDRMEIFRIINVGGPEDRRTNWNLDIEEHSDRGVVFLSDYLGWTTTKEFISKTGAPSHTSGKMLMNNGTYMYNWSDDIEIMG